MRFLSLLKSGVSVKNVALQFVQSLIIQSWQQTELSLEIACDFVNDILKAIGLECAITPEQINDGGTYIWPIEQIQIYNFHYVAMEFKQVEEFLGEMCFLVQQQNAIFINDLKEYHNDDLESPVEYLMQLTAVWCNVYKQLQKMEELHVNKHFEEPLARINFHLLLGVHELRKMYRLDLHLLDAICTRLYWSALQGLYYQQTHDMIFSGLLEIFSKNYDLFYACSARTIYFFYEAFSVEINPLTPIKLYQTLQKMILEADNANQLNILLNFLIEPDMLQVYFTTFVSKKYTRYHKYIVNHFEKIQEEALKFLNILQSELLTLDCFSREFLESILNLVFKTNPTTSALACNLYMTMMKRKFSEQMILKHIMDFYVAHLGSIDRLRSYVQLLYEHFEYLLSFNSLLEIITDPQTAEVIRLLSAHILVIVFELKYQKRDSAGKKELEHVLQVLPEMFENLECQKTKGILLKAFSLIPIENIKKPTVDNFIHYAVGVFSYTECSLEYPLLMNIFVVFHKCLMHNKEWHHLESVSSHLVTKYDAMIDNLKQLEENRQKLLSKQSLEICNNLIKRFNIMLKTKYDLLDNNYLGIICNLSHYFLHNSEIKSLISENKSLIDLYALEIIIYCVLKLLTRDNDSNHTYASFPEAQEVFKFLWLQIKNLEELLILPVVKIKTYFCSFLQLINYIPFELRTEMYHQLVQIIVLTIFKNNPTNRGKPNELQQLHPLQSLEYQRLMLRQFTRMHKSKRIQIDTKAVWKVCIYYGMFKHNFNEELKNLLITLGNYRLPIYKHIISVLIYNLHKQTPSLKYMTIMSILKQHKHLIENNIKVESSQLLKVHVVLLVLQILDKALSVQRIRAGHNRLEPLRHLHIFIEDLDLKQLHAEKLILKQASKLRKHLIVAEECKILSDFEKLLTEQIL